MQMIVDIAPGASHSDSSKTESCEPAVKRFLDQYPIAENRHCPEVGDKQNES
jgi:hypothetical protein